MEEKKLNSVENVNVVVENSTKEKVNKVSAKKAKAQSKANNILYKDILAYPLIWNSMFFDLQRRFIANKNSALRC